MQRELAPSRDIRCLRPYEVTGHGLREKYRSEAGDSTTQIVTPSWNEVVGGALKLIILWLKMR